MSIDDPILYRTEDGQSRIHLRTDGDTVWLTQAEMAELFDTSKQNVSLHVRNILKKGELLANSVIKDSLTTATDGKNYRVKGPSLPMTLAVGYRVRSQDAVTSRISPRECWIRHDMTQQPLTGRVQRVRPGASL